MNKTDIEEISEIYERHGTRLLRMCYLYLGSKEKAEDALQETFVNICRNYGNYRGGSDIKTWITRIAINVCLNEIKRSKNHTVLSLSGDDEGWDFPDESNNADIELNLVFVGIIKKLPLKLRQVTIMYYYMGYNMREISDLLGMNRSSVEFYIKQSKKEIKKELKGVGIDEKTVGRRNETAETGS